MSYTYSKIKSAIRTHSEKKKDINFIKILKKIINLIFVLNKNVGMVWEQLWAPYSKTTRDGKTVKLIRSTCITYTFWWSGLIFLTHKKKFDSHNMWVEVGVARQVWVGPHINSFFFFSIFIFYHKIYSYIVDYSYTLWTILLIINLYFIVDMINLWSVNFLMYLGLNVG